MMPRHPDPVAYLTGRLNDAPVPAGVSPRGAGAKFAPDGTVLPWRGNTILCHVPHQSPAHAALCTMQAELQASGLSRHFTYLPPDSFHMTVFQGISNGTDWPAGVPPGATLAAATDTLATRLDKVSVPSSFDVAARGLFAGLAVTMAGADPADEASLRQTRRLLRDATGITPANLEGYVFHITLAYLLRWLDDADAQKVVALSDRVFARFAAPLGRFTLGPLEFCSFGNMHHFHRERLL